MTVFWFITTAIFFIAWILTEVRRHICNRGWNNAIQWKDRVQEVRDKVQKERDELRKSLAYVELEGKEAERRRDELVLACEKRRGAAEAAEVARDGFKYQLARVAEAVKEEREALTKTIEQLEQLFLSGRGTEWTRHVYDYISNDTLRMQVREEWNERTQLLIRRQIEDAPEATPFLDEFLAEQLPAATSEVEE